MIMRHYNLNKITIYKMSLRMNLILLWYLYWLSMLISILYEKKKIPENFLECQIETLESNDEI